MAALYLALSVALLPPAEYPRALGNGVLTFAIIVGMAHILGRGRLPGMSVFAVWCAAGGVLAFPTLPGMGGTVAAAPAVGFVGAVAATMLWVALRWEPRLPSPPMSLGLALLFGLAMTVLLCVIATIPIGFAYLSGEFASSQVLLVYPAYLAGCTGAALVYWLLQRVSHLATGLYLIGFLGGVSLYGAVGPLAELFDNEPLSPGKMVLIAVLAGALVGPPVALGFADQKRNGANG